ncbi:MAG: hypothetical protein ABIU87_01960 [Ornithinibacter sp.]
MKGHDDLLTLAVSLGVAGILAASQLIIVRRADHAQQDAGRARRRARSGHADLTVPDAASWRRGGPPRSRHAIEALTIHHP